MNLIVAIDQNWGIGFKGDLLCKIPADMKYFKQKTLHNVVVMGKNTFISLPQKPLKDRINVVLTTDYGFDVPGVVTCHDIDSVLHFVSDKSLETFIIGGQAVYTAFLPYVDTAYITKICHTFPADKFIPPFTDSPEWVIMSESEVYTTSQGIPYQFLVYKKGIGIRSERDG